MLDLVKTHVSFLALSFAVRVVEALGSAGTLTATFAIIAAEFPESVATTFVSNYFVYNSIFILSKKMQ